MLRINMNQAQGELRALRAKLEAQSMEGREMTADEIKEMARMGKAAMHANLFTVRPISNGFLMDYDDVEEYQVSVPEYLPRAPGAPRALPGAPTMKKVNKWKIVRKEVFCADAAAIKVEVDRALGLADRVKQMKAQDVLLGDEEFGTVEALV